jgi:hypothetical protein
MANGIASNLPNSNQTTPRPPVTSYDSGYEFSLDHYVDVRLLMRDGDEASDVPATYAPAS